MFLQDLEKWTDHLMQIKNVSFFNPSPVSQPSVGRPFLLKPWWDQTFLWDVSISLWSSNEAESTAQAVAFSWEETKHQPWRPKSSGMHPGQGVGGNRSHPPTDLSKGALLWCGEENRQSYIHHAGIAPLHWTRHYSAAISAIKTVYNYSQWAQKTPRFALGD